MLSTKSLLFLAALAAVWVAPAEGSDRYILTEAQIANPMSITLDDLPFNTSIPEYDYHKEILPIYLPYGNFTQGALNLTDPLCPCTVMSQSVPLLTWIGEILLAVVQAIAVTLLNPSDLCSTLSSIFNLVHSTPLGWNCCTNCQYTYLPTTTIFAILKIFLPVGLITLNLFNHH